jgi:hypothetical protein
LNPDTRVAALISRRRITDGRDSFMPKESRVETPETIAEMPKTQYLRNVTSCKIDELCATGTYHPNEDVLMYVATAGPMPKAETAQLIQM